VNRRDFITLLGGAAAAPSLWPLPARAQQPPLLAIGYLYVGSPEPNHEAAFRKGLSEMGYVEGRNIAVESRFAQDQFDRLPALATDLVRRGVAVIATPISSAAALAAKEATATIPIVFSTGADPVHTGLVASLNRPGGNVTGISSMNAEIAAKRLGFMYELIPSAERFAVLTNPYTPQTQSMISDPRAAAAALGRQIEVLAAGTPGEIDLALANLARLRADALLVSPDVMFNNRRIQLVTLAAHYRIPAIYWVREDAEAGGLMSYGSSVVDQLWQVGIYAGRILKGEKPADLPILRATKFELVINLQTAKTLGITIPPTMLAIADEVIE
jgi:putative ABC transport system substrate-binding protein